MQINLEPNIDEPDSFYNKLIQLYEGLNESESREVQARLILLLSNHIGDSEALYESMRIARESFEK